MDPIPQSDPRFQTPIPHPSPPLLSLPQVPEQFSGVSYCLATLATVEHSVHALVHCDVVRTCLGHMKVRALCG